MNPKKLTCHEAVELVTEYLERTLLPELEARFKQHLDACAGCTLYLDQMRRTLHTLQQLTNETVPEEDRAILLQLFNEWQKDKSSRGFVMTPTIRSATPADAQSIGQLMTESANYLRALGDTTAFKFTAETYLRDGFGPNPAFAGLVAVIEGEIVGHLLYHFGYDTDRAMRLLHVIDLMVRADKRDQGIGTALMRQAAELARQAGANELVWAVYKPNKLAAEFYERLGAEYINDLYFMRWEAPV
jgi:GNAT superfamily N-acetyltransferase